MLQLVFGRVLIHTHSECFDHPASPPSIRCVLLRGVLCLRVSLMHTTLARRRTNYSYSTHCFFPRTFNECWSIQYNSYYMANRKIAANVYTICICTDISTSHSLKGGREREREYKHFNYYLSVLLVLCAP